MYWLILKWTILFAPITGTALTLVWYYWGNSGKLSREWKHERKELMQGIGLIFVFFIVISFPLAFGLLRLWVLFKVANILNLGL